MPTSSATSGPATRTVEQLRPRVTEIADELIANLAGQREVDLHSALFEPLPIYVIAELLGVPRDDWSRLAAVSTEFAKFIDAIGGFDIDEMSAALAEFREMLASWVAERRRSPGGDLLSALIDVADDGDRLSEEELEAMVALLMTAGHETTTGLLGNAVVALRHERAARRRLAAEPDLAESAVEEFLRFDSPVQTTARMAVEDMDLGGVTIAAGDAVAVLIGAANRDPRRYDRPNRLILERDEGRALSFGHGIHHCVGAALARLEAAVVLPALYRAQPDLTVLPERIRWKGSMILRGPIELPVRL